MSCWDCVWCARRYILYSTSASFARIPLPPRGSGPRLFSLFLPFFAVFSAPGSSAQLRLSPLAGKWFASTWKSLSVRVFYIYSIYINIRSRTVYSSSVHLTRASVRCSLSELFTEFLVLFLLHGHLSVVVLTDLFRNSRFGPRAWPWMTCMGPVYVSFWLVSWAFELILDVATIWLLPFGRELRWKRGWPSPLAIWSLNCGQCVRLFLVTLIKILIDHSSY